MSQLAILEVAPTWIEAGDEVPVEEIEESPQLVVPQILREEKAAEARRLRRIMPVPSRDAYLPGDRGDPPRRNGVIQPRRFNLLSTLKAVPGLIPDFFDSRVPDGFWSRDADTAGPLAIVACPCGEEVEVPEARTAQCECGRWYLNGVDRILVGNQVCERAPA